MVGFRSTPKEKDCSGAICRDWKCAFKAQNDAQTTSEQLQTNFQKVKKTTFLAPKMVKMTLQEGQILT